MEASEQIKNLHYGEQSSADKAELMRVVAVFFLKKNEVSFVGRVLDFLLVLKDEDSLLSHGASLVITSMGSCC